MCKTARTDTLRHMSCCLGSVPNLLRNQLSSHTTTCLSLHEAHTRRAASPLAFERLGTLRATAPVSPRTRRACRDRCMVVSTGCFTVRFGRPALVNDKTHVLWREPDPIQKMVSACIDTLASLTREVSRCEEFEEVHYNQRYLTIYLCM